MTFDEPILGKAKPIAPPINSPNQKKKRKWTIGRILKLVFVYPLIIALTMVIFYRFVPMPFTYLMAKRAIGGDKISYSPVSLKKINRNLVAAVIAAEDARFCTHNGFEWAAMRQAAKANARGRKLRGASTISQQTAKNVFLWPERSYIRKGFEAGFTFLIETLWTKRRIMEAYLNVAEWGDGVFGAEAAARHYFKKSAANLTINEAAKLAAVLPSPRKWRVNGGNGRIQNRAYRISKGAQTVRGAGLDSCIYK